MQNSQVSGVGGRKPEVDGGGEETAIEIRTEREMLSLPPATRTQKSRPAASPGDGDECGGRKYGWTDESERGRKESTVYMGR